MGADRIRAGPTVMTQQIPFLFTHDPDYDPDAFFVTAANQGAHHAVTRPGKWGAPALVLIGPPGSGKTHLVHSFLERVSQAKGAGAGEAILIPGGAAGEGAAAAALSARLGAAATALTTHAGAEPGGPRAVAIDDADRLTGEDRALFHLWNACRSAGVPLLLTATRPVEDWPTTLPDWRSRVMAAPRAVLLPPDDALLRAVMAKLFHDRQLLPDPSVIEALILRMTRSLHMGALLVARIDETAMAEQRRITRPFALRVLAEMAKDA